MHVAECTVSRAVHFLGGDNRMLLRDDPARDAMQSRQTIIRV